MIFDYLKELNMAATVCDTQGIVLYMNDKAAATFNGNMVGQSLLDCHSQQSRDKIKELLETGGTNRYTIEKKGIKKLIYQTVWYDNGQIGGLIEFSMEIPFEMPHHVRG